MDIICLKAKWTGYLEGLQSLKNHGYGERNGIVAEISIVERFLKDIDNDIDDEDIITLNENENNEESPENISMSSPSLIKITAPYDRDLLNNLRMLLKNHVIALEERIKGCKSEIEKNFLLKEQKKICIQSYDGLL